MIKPTRDDRCYAAGLFDGEGSIEIRLRQTHGGRYQNSALRVSITNTYFPIFEWLQQRWGGHVSWRNRPIGRPCGDWILSARTAGVFLGDIVQFTQIKRQQVENALAFQATKKRKRYQLTEADRAVDLIYIARSRDLKKEG